MCAGGLRKKPSLCEVLTKPLSRCGEHSCQEDREDALEYVDVRSEGSYHPPKVAEENAIPLPIPEPTLPVVDQSCLPSDQENIPPCTVMPPPINVLVPIMEEEPIRVNDCCRVRNMVFLNFLFDHFNVHSLNFSVSYLIFHHRPPLLIVRVVKPAYS